MIKKLLPLLLLILIGCSKSEPIESNLLIERNNVYYEKFSNEPFSGRVKGKINGTLKNGRFEKEVFFYHDNGQLIKNGNFTKGVPDNNWKFYDENGDIVIDGILTNGDFKGHDKDNRVIRGRINENLNFHGEWFEYFDGRVTFESMWDDGNKLYHIQYDDFGKKKNKFSFDYGFKPLTFSSSNPEKLRHWDSFEDGKLVMKYSYYSSGELKSLQTWDGSGKSRTLSYNENGSFLGIVVDDPSESIIGKVLRESREKRENKDPLKEKTEMIKKNLEKNSSEN